jgi:hypothetical protein
MEEVLPPQTHSGAGFELTRLRQFTVFLENHVGRLRMLLAAIEDTESGMVAFTIEESAESALVRFVCREPDVVRESLAKSGFCFGESEVLAVELPRKVRDPFGSICSALLAAEISIHYAYPFLVRPRGPTIVLYVEDPTLAAQLLIKKGFRLIGESDLRLEK